jgi:hypothetical protein
VLLLLNGMPTASKDPSQLQKHWHLLQQRCYQPDRGHHLQQGSANKANGLVVCTGTKAPTSHHRHLTAL